ncbi:MAG: tetratricopeptide repeat protein [Pseudonocardiaceae bacterium]
MIEQDTTMIRIGQGIGLSQRGDRDAARRLFEEIWNDIGGESGDPLHRCALAHAMADVQDDLHHELTWDLRALDAADLVTDERATQAGVTNPVRGFFPSLHLNLGECYRKLGELDRAREHLQRGRAAVHALEDDGYGRMIKKGLDSLAERLSLAGPQDDQSLTQEADVRGVGS